MKMLPWLQSVANITTAAELLSNIHDRNGSEAEQLAQSPGLGAAHWNFTLLAVVHA